MFCFTGNMLGNPALNWDLTSFCQGNMPGGPESIELLDGSMGMVLPMLYFFPDWAAQSPISPVFTRAK